MKIRGTFIVHEKYTRDKPKGEKHLKFKRSINSKKFEKSKKLVAANHIILHYVLKPFKIISISFPPNTPQNAHRSSIPSITSAI